MSFLVSEERQGETRPYPFRSGRAKFHVGLELTQGRGEARPYRCFSEAPAEPETFILNGDHARFSSILSRVIQMGGNRAHSML